MFNVLTERERERERVGVGAAAAGAAAGAAVAAVHATERERVGAETAGGCGSLTAEAVGIVRIGAVPLDEVARDGGVPRPLTRLLFC